MKAKSKISAYILRSSAAALLFSCAIVALSSAISLPNRSPKVPAPQNNTAFGVTARESAASVAGLLVTTEVMVAEKPQKGTPAMSAGGMGGGMDGMDF